MYRMEITSNCGSRNHCSGYPNKCNMHRYCTVVLTRVVCCTIQSSSRHLILKSDLRLSHGITLCVGTRILPHYLIVNGRTVTEPTYEYEHLVLEFRRAAVRNRLSMLNSSRKRRQQLIWKYTGSRLAIR